MEQRDTSDSSGCRDKCLIEQYKAYLEDVGNIGARHAQTNTLYISILSALLVFLSLTSGEKSALGQINYPAQVAAGLVAILLCLAWFAHIKSFGYLYKAKFDVLRKLEEKGLPYDCYQKEIEFLNPRFFRFTTLESCVALLLMVPFIVVVLYALSKWVA